MKNILLFLTSLMFIFFSCAESSTDTTAKAGMTQKEIEKNKQKFTLRLQKHLDAVSNKDAKTLRSTMSPDGKMQLILPSSEILYSVDSFMVFHETWFEDTTWTFETKILNTEVGEKVGIGITEVVYREPERNGAPYFNRMIVSYGLEKIEEEWYIIKDHASSIEKTKPK